MKEYPHDARIFRALRLRALALQEKHNFYKWL